MPTDILIKSSSKHIGRRQLRNLTTRTIKQALSNTSFKNPEISIVYVDEGEIKSLNKTYRNIDRVTDTLSFPQNEGEFANVGPIMVLGDIVICIPVAKKQADSANHPIEKEIEILLIHSFLHLLGYDHDTPRKKKIMFSETQKLLKE